MSPGSSFNSDNRVSRPTTTSACAFACTLPFLVLLAACTPGAESLTASVTRFPADGTSGGVVQFQRGSGEQALPRSRGPRGDTAAIRILRRETTPNGERIHFRSTRVPGTVEFAGHTVRLQLRFLPLAPADQDGDGFPDGAELVTEEDRQAFRAWFVRISQSQFLRPSLAWHRGERDCSGLIRFAYREALKSHDQTYQRRAGIVLDKNLPDVRRFHYPAVPVLGRRLFRVAPIQTGPSGEPQFDVERDFAPFASAEYLMKYNTRLVARDLSRAQPADILFFLDDRRRSGDFHSMIVTEPNPARPEDTRLIYHTGGPAGLKRVQARYLLELPDRRFRPLERNPRFLGVFRLLILE